MSNSLDKKALSKAYKKTQKLKFRHQLSLIFVLGIFVMALITSLAVSNISSQIVRDREIQKGLQVTSSLAKQSELALLYQSKESAKELVTRALNFPGVKTILVATETGAVLHGGGEAPDEVRMYTPDVDQMVHEDDKYWVFSSPVTAGQSQDNVWGELDEEDSEQQEILGYITVRLGKDTVVLMEKSILNGNLVISMMLLPCFCCCY